ncbi:haspin protein kinase [Magnaporthiopsis poae ATCC 64411]|uniref:non-specific serine/threonine protein kinase n=1 Tax=Magnaporthiopsis poae (strain ATCC 64411 / 73-15) TaxID=644358 RepID=A0A0C4DSW7_MAGP6|nr:haspin protein kinase [Magnaporthiopsis poae ATCC 64411]
MPRTTAARTYGKHARRTKALVSHDSIQSYGEQQGQPDDIAVEAFKKPVNAVTELAELFCEVRLAEIAKEDRGAPRSEPEDESPKSPPKRRTKPPARSKTEQPQLRSSPRKRGPKLPPQPPSPTPQPVIEDGHTGAEEETALAGSTQTDHQILTWADVCPPGDRIEKIAEASYAEVYRVTNERGTSIIKVVRLQSPIKPQTKAQERSGLVDEEPHREEDLGGEVRISEWLADIPGFVVYKERYIVRGKATRELLETHQAFHRRMKRKDPDRLQFYPSPSRYLHDTEFLVIELGDAGSSLEDFELVSIDQVWDVLLLVAIALARAEHQVGFEHRDLHEGNLCVRQVREPKAADARDAASPVRFGRSGLDITILDYGLSRAEDPDPADDEDASLPPPIAFDLEKDLSLFTSTHAPQCRVYRQMRSFLIRGDRAHLPPRSHDKPYEAGISWADHNPYTNVLWLAYVYDYLTRHFKGDRRSLAAFRAETAELWAHLDPDAPPRVKSFPSATDVVRFVVEAGWVTEAQLLGGPDGDGGGGGSEGEDGGSVLLMEEEGGSIIEARIMERDDNQLRRSPRRRRPRAP